MSDPSDDPPIDGPRETLADDTPVDAPRPIVDVSGLEDGPESAEPVDEPLPPEPPPVEEMLHGPRPLIPIDVLVPILVLIVIVVLAIRWSS